MKLSSFQRTAVVAACLISLSACESIIESDKVNYKTQGAAKTVPLDIPPDLSQLAKNSKYSLPTGSTVTASGMAITQGTTDTTQTAAKEVNDVRMERDGQQRWLVVGRSAEKVWPIVHEFWKENGFEYALDQQSLGILETEWAENRAKIPQDLIRRTLGKVLDGLYSTGERDKFRTRIERNNNGGVDIYITHRGMVEEYKDQQKSGTVWMPRASNPELETEFLSRLMIKLGASAQRVESTIEAQAPATRVSYQPDGGMISLSESFDIAWRRVGVALDRTGFTVEDRDRAQGVYFVRYVDTTPKEEKGFFKRMFSSDKPSASGPLKYRIAVKSQNGKSEVSVLDSTGTLEKSPVTQRILKILADDLK